MKTKQVIVMRKDLNMRKGKMIAQGSHASMKVILDMMNKTNRTEIMIDEDNNPYFGKMYKRSLVLKEENPVNHWIEGKFTKVVVSVNSLEELYEIHNAAIDAHLPNSIIMDAGLTEFDGKPTITCCAIGPWESELIDEITGDLKLL